MSLEAERYAEVAKALERAEELRKEGQCEEGVRLLSDALRHGISQAQIFHRLGNIYHDMRLYDKAEYSYKRAIDHDPLHVNAHYNLGVVYKKMGRVDESLKIRKKANKLAQQNPERVKVSSEQVAQVRSFARKFLLYGVIFAVLVLVVLFIVFS